MSFYNLASMDWNGDLVNFPDKKGRLSGFFIWNEGDGKFLQYTKPRGQTQGAFTIDKLRKADYLPINMGIPVFSERAKRVFERNIPGKMSFFECIIECEGVEFLFYLSKVNEYVNIIDEDKSLFRTLTDGSKIIRKPFIRYLDGFFIVRDETYCTYLVVSQKFVDMCINENIVIDFLKYQFC
ncbi:TPA: hypothetical protein O7X39_004500 [Salmonella enterica]|uniref:imm11 family protein n=1 Tax=Salmonella enterica TaxID=28901 RepID=UPI001922EFDA|nr:hypothetical protein [Salmonella enterica subsp. enterica serovar Abony]EEJ7236604.1 hypothetical protein [Salmonella enterica subsp. salamae]MBL1250926.1 hypothetical protein [Salmonella enterica subsp. enterica serovar Ceyco]HCL5222428.1 hypothetical protein [Salmonella enterica]EEF3600634.1 hypothetical protein [Salmonella enterica subsp. enterica serovar Abony]